MLRSCRDPCKVPLAEFVPLDVGLDTFFDHENADAGGGVYNCVCRHMMG